MSKMREAFEKWWGVYAQKHGLDLTTEDGPWGTRPYMHSHVRALYDGAWEGYQAAIAAIREGGAVCSYTGDGLVSIFYGKFLTVNEPLYRLGDLI